ncbi:MAG: hypothetical protein OEZ25_04695 [Candidatus Bathyarchaeota archaeon]|nr:hypothetical protein [Candidatus Bathyarchaeota archaeon]
MTLIVSKDAVKREFARRLSLNRQILKSPYWVLPVDDAGHENYMPVGRGVKSSTLCGSHRSFSVCYNVEGHKGKFLDGADCTDKVIVRHNHLWCKKSSCPVCFIRGWSVDRARSVESRLLEGEKRGFGKVEHVMVSVPVADRGLSEFAMRKKCRDALRDRGVIGGCMIFHGFRIDREREVLVWSPHYHSLGYVENGGFDRCRNCVHKREDCRSCDGFKGREVRGYAKDDYLVKVLPERKTVFGTAFYQLNHATVRVGIKRFHCLTWFGSCAKRMFKSAKVEVAISCPVCEDEMVKSMHMGSRHIVKDIGHADYVAVFVDERLDENGKPNWVAVVGGRVG